ncbi:WD repeat-containing protein 37 [Thelohanellus kitauei]|uniref:WD repeat-containing protein 37 n=1 Tax=Thelohanellus kitauei TaxID=669202 RepID=A0A0C2M2K6_THEKT|nr:WD repeat-containing protein 37 [Thelohanellus kitauei]
MENPRKTEAIPDSLKKYNEINHLFHQLKANLTDVIEENKRLKSRIDELESKVSMAEGGQKPEIEQVQAYKFTKKMGAFLDGASSKLKMNINKVNRAFLESKSKSVHSDCVTDLTLRNQVIISSSYGIFFVKPITHAKSGNWISKSVSLSIAAMDVQVFVCPTTDEFYACSGGGDNIIHVWSFKYALELALEPSNEQRTPRESSIDTWIDQGEISVGPDRQTFINKPIFELTSHEGPISTVDWMFDGKSIVSAGWDRFLIIWDVEKAREICKIKDLEEEINYVSCHSSQKLFVSASCDSSIRLWDMRTAKTPAVSIYNGHTGEVNSAVFNSNYIISGGSDKYAKVWELRNLREPIYSLKTSSVITRISANYDGNVCIPMRNGHVRIWNFGNKLSNSIYSSNNAKSASIEASCWSETKEPSRYVYTCSIDGSIVRWNTQPLHFTKS